MANSHGRLIHVNMCVTRVSHPSQIQAFAFSWSFTERVAVCSSLSGAGQAGQRLVCPLLGVCPHSLTLLILSPVALSVIWPCDPPPISPQPTHPGDSPVRSPIAQQRSSRHHISKTTHILAQWKIAPDICDYSKPLNCLFLIHLPSCDRLSFIFTATLHLLFLCSGLFMFVSVLEEDEKKSLS